MCSPLRRVRGRGTGSRRRRAYRRRVAVHASRGQDRPLADVIPRPATRPPRSRRPVGARRSRRLLSLRDTARAMSQENVELVRRAGPTKPSSSRRPRDPAWACLTPTSSGTTPNRPGGGTYRRARRGVLRNLGEEVGYEAWEEFRLRARGVPGGRGDKVVVLVPPNPVKIAKRQRQSIEAPLAQTSIFRLRRRERWS